MFLRGRFIKNNCSISRVEKLSIPTTGRLHLNSLCSSPDYILYFEWLLRKHFFCVESAAGQLFKCFNQSELGFYYGASLTGIDSHKWHYQIPKKILNDLKMIVACCWEITNCSFLFSGHCDVGVRHLCGTIVAGEFKIIFCAFCNQVLTAALYLFKRVSHVPLRRPSGEWDVLIESDKCIARRYRQKHFRVIRLAVLNRPLHVPCDYRV